jgi:hypothetical protein
MNDEMKATLGSYLRNLLGVTLALVTTTMINVGASSPFEFGKAEWLLVAHGLWAAAVPTLIRYLDKNDPTFGRGFELVANGVSEKLATAAATAKKASSGTSVAKTETETKTETTVATKKTASKTTTKKSGGAGASATEHFE